MCYQPCSRIRRQSQNLCCTSQGTDITSEARNVAFVLRSLLFLGLMWVTSTEDRGKMKCTET